MGNSHHYTTSLNYHYNIFMGPLEYAYVPNTGNAHVARDLDDMGASGFNIVAAETTA